MPTNWTTGLLFTSYFYYKRKAQLQVVTTKSLNNFDLVLQNPNYKANKMPLHHSYKLQSRLCFIDLYNLSLS